MIHRRHETDQERIDGVFWVVSYFFGGPFSSLVLPFFARHDRIFFLFSLLAGGLEALKRGVLMLFFLGEMNSD